MYLILHMKFQNQLELSIDQVFIYSNICLADFIFCTSVSVSSILRYGLGFNIFK